MIIGLIVIAFLFSMERWGGASMIAYSWKARIVAAFVVLPALFSDLVLRKQTLRLGIQPDSVLGYGLRAIAGLLFAYFLLIAMAVILDRIQPERVFVIGRPETIPIERRLKTRVGWMIASAVTMGGLGYLMFLLIAARTSLATTLGVAVLLCALEVALGWTFLYSVSLFFFEMIRYRRMFRSRRSQVLAGSGVCFLLFLALGAYVGKNRFERSMRQSVAQATADVDASSLAEQSAQ